MAHMDLAEQMPPLISAPYPGASHAWTGQWLAIAILRHIIDILSYDFLGDDQDESMSVNGCKVAG